MGVPKSKANKSKTPAQLDTGDEAATKTKGKGKANAAKGRNKEQQKQKKQIADLISMKTVSMQGMEILTMADWRERVQSGKSLDEDSSSSDNSSSELDSEQMEDIAGEDEKSKDKMKEKEKGATPRRGERNSTGAGITMSANKNSSSIVAYPAAGAAAANTKNSKRRKKEDEDQEEDEDSILQASTFSSSVLGHDMKPKNLSPTMDLLAASPQELVKEWKKYVVKKIQNRLLEERVLQGEPCRNLVPREDGQGKEVKEEDFAYDKEDEKECANLVRQVCDVLDAMVPEYLHWINVNSRTGYCDIFLSDSLESMGLLSLVKNPARNPTMRFILDCWIKPNVPRTTKGANEFKRRTENAHNKDVEKATAENEKGKKEAKATQSMKSAKGLEKDKTAAAPENKKGGKGADKPPAAATSTAASSSSAAAPADLKKRDKSVRPDIIRSATQRKKEEEEEKNKKNDRSRSRRDERQRGRTRERPPVSQPRSRRNKPAGA